MRDDSAVRIGDGYVPEVSHSEHVMHQQRAASPPAATSVIILTGEIGDDNALSDLWDETYP